MTRCLKSNWEAAAYAAKGTILLYPQGRQRLVFNLLNRKEKPKTKAPAEAKPGLLLDPDHRKRDLRDRCFFVVLKYKDPSLKKIFKGASKEIFFLTRLAEK